MNGPGADRERAVEALWALRPRSRFLKISLLLLGLFMIAAWFLGDFHPADAFSAHRLRNLDRFLEEVRPYPLQGRAWDWGIAARWAGAILTDRGAEAALATLAIAVLAIVLAAGFSFGLSLLAARNFATAEPFLSGGRAPSRLVRSGWRLAVAVTRLLLIFLRALPEYVWAFLLLSMLGPSAWPAVLALALHNAGILGRLNAETIENSPPANLAALRALGSKRSQIALIGLAPQILPRYLLYFFYRWETCVREATILGMLGVVSLGYWIADARTRGQSDTFLFLILLGALIVLLGDLLSALARRLVRQAS